MINLMDYELVQLSDINGTVYDSGVIVKDFDPTNFTPPAEGDLLFLSSGDISINDNVDTLDLGADLNSIHFEYAELRVVTGKPAATVTVTGKGNYQGTKSATFKIVKSLTKAVSSITLDKTSLSISSNGKTKLTPKILPADATDKSITWTSSDPIIARVDSNGNVVAVKPGTATITAKTKNGKTATCKITVTSPNKTIASYDSASLKYWIEYVSEPTKQKTHKGNKINVQSTYMITHLWVSDAYNQVKTAITPKKSSSQTAEYPRLTQAGSTLINNEIKALILE